MGSGWACRDRVASAYGFSVDGYLQRQKLARAIGEQFRRIGQEAEGLDVVRLVNDLNAAKRELTPLPQMVSIHLANEQWPWSPRQFQ
jgi:hypothetical protein